MSWEPVYNTIAQLAAALTAGLALHWLVFRLVRHWRYGSGDLARHPSWNRARHASALLFVTLSLQMVLPGLLDGELQRAGLVRHLLGLASITAITWLAVALVSLTAESTRSRHDLTEADNLEARRVHTQITLLARTVMGLIVVLGAAAALMTFPRVREIGASLLVSAGFAGLAIGLAARPVLENLIAGLQLAFTQPIRIDDVVIVEGEWGRVEEITATYVVIRIWDERRLIVPFGKFISEAFENWTRRSADILGTVFIHADYTVPVAAVRAELSRICEAEQKWDGKVCVLQVTDATERGVQLRALVSAASSSDAWDLRVAVREQLVEYLQREHPRCLPRTRVELPPAPDAGSDVSLAGDQRHGTAP